MEAMSDLNSFITRILGQSMGYHMARYIPKETCSCIITIRTLYKMEAISDLIRLFYYKNIRAE